MQTFASFRSASTALLLSVPLLLGGCAEAMQDMQSAFGDLGMPVGAAADPNDSCGSERTALAETGNFFGAKILAGAAIGAGAGGLIGLLTGQNIQSTAIGAFTGAVTGGAAAYWLALQQQQQNEQALAAEVGSNLAVENQHLDYTEIAFERLMDCRQSQAAVINADYRAGIIDRPTAEAHMQQVRLWAGQDVALAQQIDGKIEARHQQFEYAVMQLGPPAAAGFAAPAVSQAQTLASTNAALRDGFATRVATAQGTVASGFQLSS